MNRHNLINYLIDQLGFDSAGVCEMKTHEMVVFLKDINKMEEFKEHHHV